MMLDSVSSEPKPESDHGVQRIIQPKSHFFSWTNKKLTSKNDEFD